MIVEKDAHEIRCCGSIGCGLIDARHGGPAGIRWCIGVSCAGWRWVDVPNPAYQPLQSQVWPQAPNLPPSHIKSTTVGYCGLAGRL